MVRRHFEASLHPWGDPECRGGAGCKSEKKPRIFLVDGRNDNRRIRADGNYVRRATRLGTVFPEMMRWLWRDHALMRLRTMRRNAGR